MNASVVNFCPSIFDSFPVAMVEEVLLCNSCKLICSDNDTSVNEC